MKALHLINRREGISLRGLTPVPGVKGSYRSACWQLADADVAALAGGWLYLHETKAKPSSIGGRITDFEEGQGDCAGRKIIVFGSSAAARGQTWRGADHGMAMNSGLVDADAQHERAGP